MTASVGFVGRVTLWGVWHPAKVTRHKSAGIILYFIDGLLMPLLLLPRQRPL
jgi:hypothetical protein